MGVYNPRIPYILGEEWVPIRNENVPYAPTVNSVEHGYSYTLTASRRIRDARLYLNKFNDSITAAQAVMFNTYPIGTEALSGPIQQVVVPCSNATITGVGGTNFSIVGSGTGLLGALSRPDDFSYLNVSYAANVTTNFSVYFDVSRFPQLAGKRILNVSLEYAGVASDRDTTVGTAPVPLINPSPSTSVTTTLLLVNSSGITLFNGGTYSNLGTLGKLSPPTSAPSGSTQAGASIQTLNLGDANQFWSGPFLNDSVLMPWTYDQLLRFRGTGSNPFELKTIVQIPLTALSTGTGGQVNITYMALRITYCEENRVMVGGALLGYNSQTNIVTQRDLAATADPVLAAGTYTTTLSYINPGDINLFSVTSNDPPAVNGLREYYALPTQPGIDVNIPFPLDSSIGAQFTKSTSHVLPQISIHTSGGVLTEIHPYGRQSVGQVFGIQTVTQEILDAGVGSNQSFPWVRFYARRFGNTTVPLTITGTTPTVTGSSASISASTFDALPEIIDGWKEVTLRFPATVGGAGLAFTPIMGAGVNPQWRWSATNELIGNRWEVLGAAAPAISGLPNNPYNLATQQLGTATYGQPAAGTTINEGWLPQTGPFVSGATDDQISDAVLIFSQDMPPVTGFTVTVTNQALTGVALNCNTYPWYVPTSMSYNQLTWVPTSGPMVPLTGFGYYELQRSDAIDPTWLTIGQIVSPSDYSFRDFEARVGILSSYRIRSVNGLLFPGPWSSTVTATLTSPGVTGNGINSTSRTLLFTSNQIQSGNRTLAFAMAFNNDTTEPFNFPEAAFTQFQFMYGRDYQTAFRPTERGGTTFNRSVLVQAAAIPPPTLADFTSLRDMLWDPSLPYVCVRDEDGNRWFANVAAPQGAVRTNNRTIYMADLTVTEVTATPAVINDDIIIYDDFTNRTATASIGNAEIGGAWTIAAGTAADFNVSGGLLNITLPSAANNHEATIGSPLMGDQRNTMYFNAPVLATGSFYAVHLWARNSNLGNDYVRAEVQFDTDRTVDIGLSNLVAGSPTSVTSTNFFNYSAGDLIGVRLDTIAGLAVAKVWNASTDVEPPAYALTVATASNVRGLTGFRVFRNTGNTNANLVIPVVSFKSF